MIAARYMIAPLTPVHEPVTPVVVAAEGVRLVTAGRMVVASTLKLELYVSPSIVVLNWYVPLTATGLAIPQAINGAEDVKPLIATGAPLFQALGPVIVKSTVVVGAPPFSFRKRKKNAVAGLLAAAAKDRL